MCDSSRVTGKLEYLIILSYSAFYAPKFKPVHVHEVNVFIQPKYYFQQNRLLLSIIFFISINISLL